MPQVIIKYEKPETLKLLKLLSKYLDFEIVSEKKVRKSISRVSVSTGGKSLGTSELKEGSSDKNEY